MLVKGWRRIFLAVSSIIIILFLAIEYYFKSPTLSTAHHESWSQDGFPRISSNRQPVTPSEQNHSTTEPNYVAVVTSDEIARSHREVFSVSTPDRRYFRIEFGDYEAINPNIIPHPTLDEAWIIVAQKKMSWSGHTVFHTELVCNAAFKHDGTLSCVSQPIILPIAATTGDKCVGELDIFKYNIGPHDARVFYGPRVAYAMYGSNSEHTCFGQWLTDFRLLTDWGDELVEPGALFRQPKELQRPGPYQSIEKNWFVFWDRDEQMYAHYDIAPKRVFAKLESDGSIGQDLAPFAALNDDNCMARYLPRVDPMHESIHQATNALSVTLCKRSDPTCIPNDFNTFILTIFQHKRYYSYHSVYEPYVMLFRQTAPFGIHAISKKPIWIHGRGGEGQGKKPERTTLAESESWSQTEMMYATSISWKKHGQRYHGYADDVMFINFGIEDSKTAAIDILAGDLFLELGACAML